MITRRAVLCHPLDDKQVRHLMDDQGAARATWRAAGPFCHLMDDNGPVTGGGAGETS
jgi:hypothetical protein